MQTFWYRQLILCFALAGCDADPQPPLQLKPQAQVAEAIESLSWLTADHAMGGEIQGLLRELQHHSNAGEWTRAVSRLMRAGNRTGDPGFYSAAEVALHGLRAISDEPGEVASATASVLQAMHRFDEAQQAAQAAVSERGLARDYGLLGDILLELGDYEGSASAYQSMVDLKPDALAYARAGHYRLALGDLDGAHQLLTIAQRGIGRGQDESYAWVLGRLAWCELLMGRHRSGSRRAEQAARIWPSPGHQLLLARARLTTGSIEQSLDVLEKLTTSYPDSQALWLQSELLDLVGQPERAAFVRNRLLEMDNPPDARGHAAYLLAMGLRSDVVGALLAREYAARQDSQTLALISLHSVREGQLHAADRTLDQLQQLDPQAALFAALAAQARGRFSQAESLLKTADRGQLMLPPSQSSLLRQLRRTLAASRTDERVASL